MTPVPDDFSNRRISTNQIMKNPAHLIAIPCGWLRAAALAFGLVAGAVGAFAQSAPVVTAHPASATVTLPTATTATFRCNG